MLRRLQACFVLGVCVASLPATAQEATDETSAETKTETPVQTQAPTGPATETAAEGPLEGWHTEVSGYFRAPVSLAISSRPGPDNLTGPASTQVSYGPNRTVDSNYYS